MVGQAMWRAVYLCASNGSKSRRALSPPSGARSLRPDLLRPPELGRRARPVALQAPVEGVAVAEERLALLGVERPRGGPPPLPLPPPPELPHAPSGAATPPVAD